MKETIKTTCTFTDVHVGFHEIVGIGLWWKMKFKNDEGCPENPIKADMRFIEEMLNLFGVKRVNELNGKNCTIEYSYSPTFHIHKFINGKKEFNVDFYLYKVLERQGE